VKYVIRPARPADVEFIANWTEDTFEWGDYVADRLPAWLDEDDSAVLVADVDGQAVGLGRIHLVSPSEAWANAMRVHPDHRRLGVGSMIGDALWESAREAGAHVVRLALEDWNDAARRQVTKAGFRSLGSWFAARRGVGDSSPVPEGNGGMRVKGAEALKPAHSAEAEPALLSWSSGELARAAHGLYAVGWTWQRLTVDDLVAAAKDRTLWEGRTGWAIGVLQGERFEVHWLETNAEDVRAMVRALVERAADSGADVIRVMIPDVGWLTQAFRRSGFDLTGIEVLGLPL